MNHKFEDLSPLLPNHVDDVSDIMDALQAFHAAREETYKLSFARRGESGVWMNLARKYDRLDLLASRVLDGADGNDGVTLVDTLVDTAIYALKWVAVIRKLRPEDFRAWVEQVYCRDTGMDLDVALLMFADDMTLLATVAEDYVAYSTSGRFSSQEASVQEISVPDAKPRNRPMLYMRTDLAHENNAQPS